MKHPRNQLAVGLCVLLLALSGCSTGGKRVIRIGHNQSADHPTNIALLAFEAFVEGELGGKYDVEVYPSELLGSQTDMVQLTQTIPYMLWYYVTILIGLLLVTYIPFLNIGLPTAAGLI